MSCASTSCVAVSSCRQQAPVWDDRLARSLNVGGPWDTPGGHAQARAPFGALVHRNGARSAGLLRRVRAGGVRRRHPGDLTGWGLGRLPVLRRRRLRNGTFRRRRAARRVDGRRRGGDPPARASAAVLQRGGRERARCVRSALGERRRPALLSRRRGHRRDHEQQPLASRAGQRRRRAPRSHPAVDRALIVERRARRRQRGLRRRRRGLLHGERRSRRGRRGRGDAGVRAARQPQPHCRDRHVRGRRWRRAVRDHRPVEPGAGRGRRHGRNGRGLLRSLEQRRLRAAWQREPRQRRPRWPHAGLREHPADRRGDRHRDERLGRACGRRRRDERVLPAGLRPGARPFADGVRPREQSPARARKRLRAPRPRRRRRGGDAARCRRRFAERRLGDPAARPVVAAPSGLAAGNLLRRRAPRHPPARSAGRDLHVGSFDLVARNDRPGRPAELRARRTGQPRRRDPAESLQTAEPPDGPWCP